MARYTVTHICGHDEEHQLFGKHADREYRLHTLGLRLCSVCWQQQRQEQREQASESAQGWAAQQGLPALEGSQKQCAWAETLRRERLEQIATTWADAGERENILERLRPALAISVGERLPSFPSESLFLFRAITESPLDPTPWGVCGDWLEEHNHEAARYLHAVSILLRQSSAKWWIDRRYESLGDLLRLIADEPARLAAEEAARQKKAAEAAALEEQKREKIAAEWAYNDAIAARAREAVLERAGDFTITVWSNHDGTEKRVYFDEGKGGYHRGGWKVCVYHTGNNRNRPGTIEGFSGSVSLTDEERTRLLTLAADLCAKWKNWKHYVEPVKEASQQ